MPDALESLVTTISEERAANTSAATRFSREDSQPSIASEFERQVRLYAERVAVADAQSALTYRNLNALANRIAHAVLARRGAGPEPVALLVGNGVRVAAAMLGVLKAGKFYVSLDVSQPQARTATILADCRPALLIVDNERLQQAVAMRNGLDPPGIPLLNLDAPEAGLSAENPALPIAGDALAYVVYTSGSTGKPKGAMQDHRYVLHLTNPRSEVAAGSPAPPLMPSPPRAPVLCFL
ncbi:hypothetical protein SBA2_580010 [Acidobacteriia bacterium SbA2]|nr:hypothetical protein SBA2_580010 [Acidobacteriia bacterium SbA2]